MRLYESAAALVVAVRLVAPATSVAQETMKDSVWNGVTIGAGVGTAAGIALAETTEEICSVGACMALMAVAGGALGLAVDKAVGDARPVKPGTAVDDSSWNGALIGSAVGSAGTLINFVEICRSRGCTTGGVIRAVVYNALCGGLVGALVDAAIPSKSRAVSSNSDVPTTASRRVSLKFRVSF